MNKGILLRIIILPFIMCIHLVMLFKTFFKFCYYFLKYGGESIVYMKKDEPTIANIYNELKKLNSN
jgi:hypothetical protein